MKSLETKHLISSVAESNNVTIKQVETVIDSVFMFLYDKMSNGPNKTEGYYPVIKVENFGRFHVPKGIAKHVKTRIQNKINNESIPDGKLEA